MLIAAPRTTTYGAGCPKICFRMCFNFSRALSLMSIPYHLDIMVHSPAEPPTPPGRPLSFLLSASCRGVGLIPLQLLRSHADIVECSKTPRRPPAELRTARPRYPSGCPDLFLRRSK